MGNANTNTSTILGITWGSSATTAHAGDVYVQPLNKHHTSACTQCSFYKKGTETVTAKGVAQDWYYQVS